MLDPTYNQNGHLTGKAVQEVVLHLNEIEQAKKRARIVRAPLVVCVPFNLNNLTEEAVTTNMRFNHNTIDQMAEILEIPLVILLPRRHRLPGKTCLAIFLWRMGTADRFTRMEPTFGLRDARIGEGFQWMLEDFNFGFKRGLFSDRWLDPATQRDYVCSIKACFPVLPNLLGFLDGCFFPIARPIDWETQEGFWSGRKGSHGINILVVVAPCGLAVQVGDFFPGPRHDSHGLRTSTNLLDVFSRKRVGTSFIGADLGFDSQDYHLLITPFKRPLQPRSLTRVQVAFNKAFRAARVEVEHFFSHVKILWPLCVDVSNLRLLTNTRATMVLFNAFVLANLHNCVCPNQISCKFGLRPPTVDAYTGKVFCKCCTDHQDNACIQNPACGH